MPQNVLVTGTGGFIGRHVVAAALSEADVRLRLVRRGGSAAAPLDERVHTVSADLADPASLTGLCEGIEAVVHCASLVGADEQSLRAVNDRGTRALVQDALRHGVRRVVYISTAAVYGRGPFRRAEAGALAVAPRSATSLTRAAAEQHVLSAGGTVLRPHLVYGRGDRWVIPELAGLLRYLRAGVHCPSVHSCIEVDALAAAALGACLSDQDLAGVHHANHPLPLRASALIDMLLAQLDLPARRLLDPEQARARVRDAPQALHHLDMLTTDHWFSSDSIWRLLDRDPGPAPIERLARHMPWYREFLRLGPAAGR